VSLVGRNCFQEVVARGGHCDVKCSRYEFCKNEVVRQQDFWPRVFGSYCTHLLYQSEVGWLSLGFVLQLIVALLSYVESFVCKESSLVLKFSFTKCILKLTYISFTFDEIKKLNIWCKALIRR